MNTDSDEPQIVQPSIKLLSSHQPLTRIVVMTLVQRWVVWLSPPTCPLEIVERSLTLKDSPNLSQPDLTCDVPILPVLSQT